MKFYRAKYDSTDQTFKIGAEIRAITWKLGVTYSQNRQGAQVMYAGKFTSSEVVSRGSVVVAEDNGRRTPYTVGPISTGMGGVSVYLLEEDGTIA